MPFCKNLVPVPFLCPPPKFDSVALTCSDPSSQPQNVALRFELSGFINSFQLQFEVKRLPEGGIFNLVVANLGPGLEGVGGETQFNVGDFDITELPDGTLRVIALIDVILTEESGFFSLRFNSLLIQPLVFKELKVSAIADSGIPGEKAKLRPFKIQCGSNICF